jgi:hypothetical protein
MALDWSFYDHQREQRGLAALDASDRLVLEAFAAEAIGLSMGDRQIQWGRAEGYGLYAAAVIRVCEGLPRRFCSHENIAIKIFHSSADKVVHFQKEIFPRIWRPPLQRTLHASVAKDRSGKRRGYLILEFAEGDSLESLLKERLSREYAEELLREFLHRCLIPPVGVWLSLLGLPPRKSHCQDADRANGHDRHGRTGRGRRGTPVPSKGLDKKKPVGSARLHASARPNCNHPRGGQRMCAPSAA